MTAHLIITGFVQGVGFRQFVKKNAKSRGVTGWVRNMPDGSVEAVLDGNKEILEEIINICNQGPVFGQVQKVFVTWEDAHEVYSSFEILHD